MNSLTKTNVLITGGTRGIGLATALTLSRLGARVAITHRWGSVTEEEISESFISAGVKAPDIFEADAAREEDTDALINALKERGFEKIDVFVSNVAFAQLIHSVEEMSRRSLLRGIEYTAWPLVGYSLAIQKGFGLWPRRIIGMSSFGGEYYHPNYDFAAAAKSVLETLAKYLAFRLKGTQVNVLRARWVETESFEATAGRDFAPFARRWPFEGQWVTPEEVAQVVVALCSGLLDGVNGQILSIDHGASFFDNTSRVFPLSHK